MALRFFLSGLFQVPSGYFVVNKWEQVQLKWFFWHWFIPAWAGGSPP